MPSTPAKRPAGHTPPGPVTRMQDITTVFSPRDRTSHKGTFGTVGVLGGGEGMAGAALLAARAALHLGAGKVLVGFLQQPAPMGCDIMQPELMCRDARGLLDNDPGVTAWVAGCGAGQTPYAVDMLSQLLARPRDAALVLDADALNLLAAQRLILPVALPASTLDTQSDALTTTGSPVLSPNVDQTHPVVLTPHPAEAARLLNTTAATIQADRSGAAKQLARQFGAWVVLKGADTVVSDPTGEWRVNPTGNPGLATAGTGDVLAGMIGSLLAQSLPVRQAVLGGVWLHGAAADACVAAGRGPIGLTAGELALAARHLRNHPPEID